MKVIFYLWKLWIGRTNTHTYTQLQDIFLSRTPDIFLFIYFCASIYVVYILFESVLGVFFIPKIVVKPNAQYKSTLLWLYNKLVIVTEIIKLHSSMHQREKRLRHLSVGMLGEEADDNPIKSFPVHGHSFMRP